MLYACVPVYLCIYLSHFLPSPQWIISSSTASNMHISPWRPLLKAMCSLSFINSFPPISSSTYCALGTMLRIGDIKVNQRTRNMFSMELTIQWVKPCQIMSDSDSRHKENNIRWCDRSDEERSEGLYELCDKDTTIQRSNGRGSVLGRQNVKCKGPEAGEKAYVAGL